MTWPLSHPIASDLSCCDRHPNSTMAGSWKMDRRVELSSSQPSAVDGKIEADEMYFSGSITRSEITSPVVASQTVYSLASEQESVRVPSGENATVTFRYYLVNGISTLNRCASDCAFHKWTLELIVLKSAEPETTRVPSGENATESTVSKCRSSKSSGQCNVASHTRTLQSHEPHTMCVSSGENATGPTVWPSLRQDAA